MPIISTDPVADMLTRIRNAINVSKNEVLIPHSKLKQAIAKLLVESRFIDSVNTIDGSVGKMLKVTINPEGQNAKITEISRMSKPGRRLYVGVDEIPQIKRGRGIVIVSTSQGLMTDKEARNKRLGGELICKVY